MLLRITVLCVLVSPWTTTLVLAQSPDAAVQATLDKFRTLRPADKDLGIFQLEWLPSLKDAREKAAPEKRPIFLIVVTNSYGNLYTGHC